MTLSPRFVLKVKQGDTGIKTVTVVKVDICHMKTCIVNHTSSSKSMEKAAAVEMFGQSLSLHNRHKQSPGGVL